MLIFEGEWFFLWAAVYEWAFWSQQKGQPESEWEEEMELMWTTFHCGEARLSPRIFWEGEREPPGRVLSYSSRKSLLFTWFYLF